MKSLHLPESGIERENQKVIETEQSVIIVGANGSGKTRLGTWIEFDSRQKNQVHRISAQKSLTIPENIQPKSLKRAEMELKFGLYRENSNNNRRIQDKKSSRWRRNPATSLLNDYQKLLVYLFSEDYEKMIEYKKEVKNETERVEPPENKIDIAKKIWESIIPQRKLKISSSSITTSLEDDEEIEYNAKEMSDGERVIFYLIGECLSAPKDGIIVVDEPELHLHKSIQQKLWDEIEKERDDCLFVYLTHDLDFASTRSGAQRICLNEYDGNKFYWYLIDKNDKIPENIYLEILGSREPIIFVEGEKGSYDEQLYKLVYPEYTVESVGGCQKVIEFAKSFQETKPLHNIDCRGIIDRDYRKESHLKNFEEKGVYSPKVAEVENLFLIDSVLYLVAEQFCEPSPESVIEEIHDWICEEFEKNKEKYAIEATSAHVNYTINGFNGKVEDTDELKSNLSELIENIDIDDYYEDRIQYADELIENREYENILKIFNHKGLVNQVGKFFDIKPSSYTAKVKNIIKSGNVEILDSLREYLPDL